MFSLEDFVDIPVWAEIAVKSRSPHNADNIKKTEK